MTLLHRLSSHRRIVIILMVVFLFVLALFFPVPMSDSYLTNDTRGQWCPLSSLPFARSVFYPSGEYFYWSFLPDSSGGSDAEGLWEMNGSIVDIALTLNNTPDTDLSFEARPILGGYLLWMTFGFNGDIEGIPIWKKC